MSARIGPRMGAILTAARCCFSWRRSSVRPRGAQEHKLSGRPRGGRADRQRLAFFGKLTNIDFSVFDLDQPLSGVQLTTNGHQLNLDQFLQMAGNRPLREVMADYGATGLSVELVGTPDSVAARMGEVIEDVGGDGYLFSLQISAGARSLRSRTG